MSQQEVTGAPQAPRGCGSESEFNAVVEAYRASGGCLCSHELARRLEQSREAYLMSLEKLIAARMVFAFEWRGRWWVPMFQFHDSNLRLRPASELAVAELSAWLGGWALATWFARPRATLKNLRPVDLLDSNPDAVVQAARAQRRAACTLAARVRAGPCAPAQAPAADAQCLVLADKGARAGRLTDRHFENARPSRVRA